MNKKSVISFGLIAILLSSVAIASAESTVYTDGLGRVHFLGKDPDSNKARQNYANPKEQDLTRRLYENSTGEMNNVDYRFKDYDNTFGFGKMDTQTIWKNKFVNNVDASAEEATQGSLRGSMTYEKGSSEKVNASTYGVEEAVSKVNRKTTDNGEVNVIKEKTSAKKKHWWNKNK